MTGGTWLNPALGLKSDRHVLRFLALEVYFEAAGCRFDVVKRLLVAYINNATRLPKECAYCHNKSDNIKSHKKDCRKRRKARRRGEIKDEEDNVHDFIVQIHKHKTSDSTKLMLVISNRLIKILRILISTKYKNKDADGVAIFGSIKW